MKLLKTSRRDGYTRIEVENEDDLWRLEPLVEEGDRVRALTQRTQLDGREKKTLKLKLEVEKVALENGRLRVTGEITEADDQVELGYHTFNLEEGDEFELWKGEVTESFWEELEDAESRKSYEVLFVLVEKGEADLYVVRESGIEPVSSVVENVPGKLYEDDTGGDFEENVAQMIERSSREVEDIVLGGPGFEKQKVMNSLSEETGSKVFMQDTSVTGRTGLSEAIKRGALKKVVESSRIDEETEAFESFLERLESGGKADYGEPVRELAKQGAVEKLLITVKRSREEKELIQEVERNGGEVQRIHTDHEAGERLENLGGIGALLRYQP